MRGVSVGVMSPSGVRSVLVGVGVQVTVLPASSTQPPPSLGVVAVRVGVGVNEPSSVSVGVVVRVTLAGGVKAGVPAPGVGCGTFGSFTHRPGVLVWRRAP